MTSSRRRGLKPWARRGLSAVVEGVWAAGFGVAGALLRPQVGRWKAAAGRRVLVVSPHPDDEAIGCAGTILLHAAAGEVVGVVHATDGRGSRTDGAGAYAARRRQEASVAAERLGVARFEWLGLPEDAWTPVQLASLLGRLLADWSPDVVYAPSRIDYHPDHRHVAHALALALDQTGARSRPPAVRIYPVQVPLTPRLANLAADVSSLSAAIAHALDAYASQRHNTVRAHRIRRYAARLYRLGSLAEEFWEMSAGDYAILHRQPPGAGDATAFRGIRRLPLTDPLAYVVGREARSRLAQAPGRGTL